MKQLTILRSGACHQIGRASSFIFKATVVAALACLALLTPVLAVRWEPDEGARRAAQPAPQRHAAVRAPSATQARSATDAAFSDATIEWSVQLGTPSCIRAKDLRPQSLRKRSIIAQQDDAMLVLQNVAGLLGARNPASEFVPRDVLADDLGTRHVKVDQYDSGRRVVGGQLVVHFAKNGEAYQVNGRYVADLGVAAAPTVTPAQAFVAAEAYLVARGRTQVQQVAEPELVIYAYNVEPFLAYEMQLTCTEPRGVAGRWRLWIDAASAQVAVAMNDVRHVVPPTDLGSPAMISGSMLAGETGNTTNIPAWYENTGLYYLYNTSQRWYVFNVAGAGYLDNNTYAFRTDSNWGVSDRAEVSAANNFRHIQNYFRQVHGRSSFDDAGTMARANVHYMQNYNNAEWDGTSFNFGDGDAAVANNLAVLDVAAHEFGHAMMDHTANLFYYGESGALHESFSDIWGACVEFYAQRDGRAYYPGASPGRADWLIGEDAWVEGRALRDMREPGSTVTLAEGYQQPSLYKGTNWWDTSQAADNGGIHFNGGVQNFMFYLLSEGGSGVNGIYAYGVTGIGVTNAARIAYRALTTYFTVYTDFSDARRCWVSAAEDLNQNWVPSVEAAWNAVGVWGDELSPTLGEAVNAQHLPWYTGGAVENNWFAETYETYDGIMAAQSGAVGHNQDTRIMTALRGPGQLSFYWQVESQGNADFLSFFVDNQKLAAISGRQLWHKMSFEIPSGYHTLKWVYQKDHRLTTGSDAGWLDLVNWTPYPARTPTGFSASDGTTSAGVQLSWQPSQHADWYEIWRGPNSDTVFAEKIGQSTSAGYLDASIPPLDIAYYWVSGANPNGESGLSACDFGYRALPGPDGMAATEGTLNDAVLVSWNALTNATAYEIWRSTSPNLATATPMYTNLTSLSYRDTDTVPGLAYHYWTRARGFVVPALPNIGSFSSMASGWRYIPPPHDVRASDGAFTDKVRIIWTPVTGANGYEVWRSLNAQINSALQISSPGFKDSYFDDPSTLIGVTYYYWVRSVAPVGMSDFSEPDSGWRTSPLVPSAPTNVVASDGTYSNKVRVSWARVEVANTYEVWRSTKNDASTAVWMDNTAGLRYDDFEVTIGTKYYYWVKAKGEGGTGAFSEPDSGFAAPGGVPEPKDYIFNDYNGDSVSDLAVYNEETGLWFVATPQGVILVWNFAWGAPGLIPAPGDFRGDGRMAYSVYSPVFGTWYIRTGAGTQLAWDLPWGGGGMVSVYGDYDGDGICDLAVYNPQTGAWYARSLNNDRVLIWGTEWGGPGLWPVPGDYDGDGRYDLAVYEPATGRWFVYSTLGYTIEPGNVWGGPGFEPVMGDYNGDKLSDLAVYNRATGAWYIRTIYGSYLAWDFYFGGPGMVPYSGDFDGDGRFDLAVHDTITGQWFICTLSLRILVWGLPWGGPGFEPVRGAPSVW